MRIQHTLKREGKTISGKITNTIFEGDEKRADCKVIKIGNDFYACSASEPAIKDEYIRVYGEDVLLDDIFLCYTYDTEERAIEVMKAINSITIEPEPDKINLDKEEVIEKPDDIKTMIISSLLKQREMLVNQYCSISNLKEEREALEKQIDKIDDLIKNLK